MRESALIRCLFLTSNFFSIFLLQGVSGEETKNPNVDKREFSHSLLGDRRMYGSVFSVDNVVPGSILDAFVMLQNETLQKIRYERVEFGCKCMSATVPDKEIDHGGILESSFRIKIPDDPRVTEEIFGGVVHGAAGTAPLRIGFKVTYAGIVAFSKPEFVLPYSVREEEVTFRLPLACGSKSLLDTIRIVSKDDLVKLRAKPVWEKDSCFLECSFKPAEIGFEEAIGQILIHTKSGFSSDILCRLCPEKSIEIIPSTLVFNPIETNANSRRATAIVRLRSVDATKLKVALIGVECNFAEGLPLNANFTQIGQNVYRVLLEVEIENKKAEEVRPSGELRWKLRTDLGDLLNVNSNYKFVN